MKKIFCLCFAVLAVIFVHAEADVQSDTSVSLTVSSVPEAKLTLAQNFAVPFLRGDHFLVAGNNIRFSLSGELAPIAMNLKNEVVLTPVAFLEFAAGGMIGSGWNIELFGGDVWGIGVNRPDAEGNTSADGSAFDSMFAGGHFGGAFQFDMAAIFPGDWNHVVVRTYQELGYMSYGRAAPGEPWFYENDSGENQNGWVYLGNYVLGYQMPIFLNMVAFQAEMKKFLYDTPGGGKWGDDLGYWELSALMNFTVTKKLSVALITQFRTLRRYNEYGYGKDEDKIYYRDRTLQDGNSRRVAFYRVAAIIQYEIHSNK